MQAQADPFHGGAQPHHCSVLGMGLGLGGGGGWGGTEWGCSFLLAANGREKKYTCYLVNPQTCKIGIS